MLKWCDERSPPLGACSVIQSRRKFGADVLDYVHIVKWTSAEVMLGQIYVTGEKGRPVWSVPSVPFFQCQPFADCVIIVPGAGVQPVKFRAARPDVPLDTLAMMQMWKTAVNTCQT